MAENSSDSTPVAETTIEDVSAENSARPSKKMFETCIVTVDPRTLTLLETNAQYMTHEQYHRLVENIKSDGVLTSTPFCWVMHDDNTKEPMSVREDGELQRLVMSGNHRVMASIDAGLETIDIILCVDYISPSHRLAIQLSHNEVVGQSDVTTLKILYETIDDIDYRIYSGLDDKRLDLLQDASPASISEANLTFQTISMTFMPTELEAAKKAWDAAEKELGGNKESWLARFAQYDAWMDQVEKTSRLSGIKNVGSCTQLILAVYLKHSRKELEHHWLEMVDGEARRDNEKLPLDAVFDSPFLPAKTLAKIRRVTDKMISAEVINKDNRAASLEEMANFWLENN